MPKRPALSPSKGPALSSPKGPAVSPPKGPPAERGSERASLRFDDPSNEDRPIVPDRIGPEELRRLVDEATRPGIDRHPPGRGWAGLSADVPSSPRLPSESGGDAAAWPSLPGPGSADEEPWLDALREAERRRRLDLEQRGWPWSA